jgi:outer membrane protein assembly factor BamB
MRRIFRRAAVAVTWAAALAVPDFAAAETAVPIASPEAGWPQFRGPRRDGISQERGLLQTWPEAGPPLRWSATGAGKGFSSTIIGGGRLYVTGDFGDELRILAYDLDGKPLWSARNGDAWLNQYQGARASVTYFDGRVYHLNAHGRIACLDAATGRELWVVELLARFRGENIRWGLSECLLVDEHAVYAAAGGRDALLVALGRRTGEVRWQTPPLPGRDGGETAERPGYASPILVHFAGRRLLVGCTEHTLYCADAATGRLQWTRPRPTSYGVLAMTPVLVGDAIFVAAPLGAPGKLFHLVAPAAPDQPVGVRDGWSAALDTCQGGVLHVDGRLYGPTYPRRGGWNVLSAATGELVFETTEIPKGSAIWADRRLYVLAEDGWLRLLAPAAKHFDVQGCFRLVTARDRDAWAHPVIHDGRLYLRFHDTLWCYDLKP